MSSIQLLRMSSRNSSAKPLGSCLVLSSEYPKDLSWGNNPDGAIAWFNEVDTVDLELLKDLKSLHDLIPSSKEDGRRELLIQ